MRAEKSAKVSVPGAPMLGWCDRSALVRAGIPSRWCAWFMRTHAGDTRKLGDAQQAKRLYSIAAVNAAIDAGESGGAGTVGAVAAYALLWLTLVAAVVLSPILVPAYLVALALGGGRCA